MGVLTQSALIAAIVLVAMAVNLLFKSQRIPHRTRFVGLLLGLVVYYLSVFFSRVAAPSLFWRQLMLLSGISLGPLALGFFQAFLDERDRHAERAVTLGAIFAAALVVLPTRLRDGGFVGGFSTLYALAVLSWCVWQLFRRYRATDTRIEALRLLYLVIGGAAAVTFSALDLLPLVGVPFPSLGHLLTLLYMYLWTQIIQRSRFLDLNEVLGRGLLFLIQALALSLVYTTMVVWVGERLGLFFYNTLLASVVLILIFEPLQQVVDKWLARLLFRERYELEVELDALRRELASVINLGDLAARLLTRLESSRRITHASVFLLESDGRGYFRPRAVGPVELASVGVVKGRAFLETLRREKVLTLEQVERDIWDIDALAIVDGERHEQLEDIRATMHGLAADVSFGFVADERLVGFLNVRDERVREAFSSEEIRQIAGVAAQATVIIENSALFDQLKERDRLSALGEMAAGLAHEIRNPLGAIKGAAQVLEPGGLDDEQREFLDVIVEEVDRLDSVVRQFLDYARPYRGQRDSLDVNRVVERVATMVRAEAREPVVAVVVNLEAELPPVTGEAGQIQQVLLNLVRNACEAMDEGGVLTLETASSLMAKPGRPRERQAAVEVRVRDTGPGIPPASRENLFIPFFTTKPKGTGLGLAICQRIAQHHGGTITFHSREGRGTTFTVTVPAAEAHSPLSGEHRRVLDQPVDTRVEGG